MQNELLAPRWRRLLASLSVHRALPCVSVGHGAWPQFLRRASYSCVSPLPSKSSHLSAIVRFLCFHTQLHVYSSIADLRLRKFHNSDSIRMTHRVLSLSLLQHAQKPCLKNVSPHDVSVNRSDRECVSWAMLQVAGGRMPQVTMVPKVLHCAECDLGHRRSATHRIGLSSAEAKSYALLLRYIPSQSLATWP